MNLSAIMAKFNQENRPNDFDLVPKLWFRDSFEYPEITRK